MSCSSPLKIVIAAGGTGGHFFPAEALATELGTRGHTLILMTDRRHGARATGFFADRPQYVLDGAGVAGKGLAAKLRGLKALAGGTFAARALLKTIAPDAVVGFGGYPSVPPLLAARLMGGRRPALVIHEGNAVLGQANALLARFADAVATSYPVVARFPPGKTAVLTGMPVRPGIAALIDTAYDPPGETLNLLVWGGSLGARVFSDVVPEALAALPPGDRARLRVTQQVRQEDAPRVAALYRTAGIIATTAPFFDNVPDLLAAAHLVIGRAGGSSVAELTMAGRPAIMVPLPVAASDEQGANAEELVRAGAGWMIRQPDFTAAALTQRLETLLADPAALPRAAAAARALARPGSAALLADLVESTCAAYASPSSPTL
ncbi:undecaprenyldiphospho-muramoylpentapeptide beta-N-acetylglucosaminyltransferase [Acidomonas methanolica]|uniref:undecaprenyldiphospho-muramoylpentapeptide beta-N-acetylglucosaminyltransferase n=1 Tax=Acidomonas methanolica TaxID=437 RepID=UPI002119E736|nr:undecaprenyldiphospho-muramoylpentapeptide beta-N-acetylglucosaminyltransferase [Acidomonas methanolica]MCQ9156057.1 undecaprenyldiphospho-muramoylpentapeptide beta-N-acetylglucosaminyltransferase [Acidomonas methanolica]